MIQRTMDGVEIFDLMSTTGIVKNGVKVEAAELSHADEIAIGAVRILFLDAHGGVLPTGLQHLFFDSGIKKAALAGDAVIPPEVTDAVTKGLRKTPGYVISALIHILAYIVLLSLDVPEKAAESTETAIVGELGETDVDAPPDEKEILESLTPDEKVPEPPLPTMSEIDSLGTSPGESDTDILGDDPNENVSGSSTLGLAGTLGGGAGSGGAEAIGRGLSDDLPSGNLGSSIRALRASGLDIAVLIDSTGSMDDEIDGAKKRIGDMIALMDGLGIEFRLAVVAYRDKGDDYVLKSQPLTPHRFKAVEFLDGIESGGGGDIPEAVYDAIAAASQMQWSSKAKRVIVVVGDAPPHEKDLQKTVNLAKRFAEGRGQVHLIYTDSPNQIDDVTEVRTAFRRIAQSGEGAAVGMSDHTRIIEDILCLAFGTEDREGVARLLNDKLNAWDARTIRRRLDDGDCEFVVKEMSSKDVHPALARELLLTVKESLVPAFLRVLARAETRPSERWLAHCLLKRALARAERYASIGNEVRAGMRELNPEGTVDGQRRAVLRISKALIASGFIDRAAVAEILNRSSK